MGTFVSQRLALLPVPLSGPNGQLWASTMGAPQDAELGLLQLTGRLRSTSKVPTDGLDNLGALYSLARAPRELVTGAELLGTDTAYRDRLGDAWAFWGTAPMVGDGMTLGLSSLFAVYLDPNTPSLPPQILSGAATGLPSWAEVVIVWPSPLAPDDAWDANDFDDGAPLYDDGGIWDVEYTPDNPNQTGSFGVADLAWFRRQIRLCQGGGAYPVRISVGLGFDALGASALWDDGGIWDSELGMDYGTWDSTSTNGLFTTWTLGHTWEEETLVPVGVAFSTTLPTSGGEGTWDNGDGVLWDDGTTEAYTPPTTAGW
jgi:hypothetical protein